MKRFLLIKTNREKNKFFKKKETLDNIGQFFIFTEFSINFHTIIRYHEDYIISINEDHYNNLKKYKLNQINKMTKQQLFILCGMEEFLI
jgi:hypothetical protein